MPEPGVRRHARLSGRGALVSVSSAAVSIL
jgi:hypothetical protein